MSKLSENLKDLRKNNNLTQSELGQILGVTYFTLGKWEVGKAEPSADMLLKLADYFDVTIDYLLGREDDFGNLTISPLSSGKKIGQTSDLTEDEEELLDCYRALSQNLKETTINTVKMWAGKTSPNSLRKNS